jgi:type I restriction enzyme, S subunit
MSPFSEVADYGAGHTPGRARAEYWDQTGEVVPWITISDLRPYGTVCEAKEGVSKVAFDSVFRGTAVPAGTLLMSFKLTIGRVATLAIPAVHNEAIIAIYPRQGVDQRFLGYYLSQVDYASMQDRQIKGNTLNRAKIDQIPVPVPDEDEQRAIADLLDQVRLAIDSAKEALRASLALKRGVARKLLSHESTDEHGELISIALAAEWITERVADSNAVSSGGTPSRAKPEYWTGGTIPWVKTTEVNYSIITKTSEHITQRGLEESAAKLLPVGTVLLAMYGQGMTRGKVGILGIEAACNQACAAIQPNSDALDSRYLYHYLASQYDEMRQLAHGGQQQNLNLDIVGDFPINYPKDRKAQAEVVDFLDALDESIHLHEARIPILERLFGALLSGLMSEELSVVDAHGLQFADAMSGTAGAK